MGLKEVRQYQQEFLRDLETELNSGTSEVCVAACPSAGKTHMMIELMRRRSDSTFLVLTHGQRLLKDRWTHAFTEEGLMSEVSDSVGVSRITYGLPQSLHTREIPQVDYLIIDEAHHFAHADMVQSIIKKAGPKHILYVTGTPSTFVARGVRVLALPALDLIPDYLADMYVGLVATSVQFTGSDRDADGFLSAEGKRKIEKLTDEDLENLLVPIVERLRESDFLKSRPSVRNLTTWAPTLGSLGKTMIACASITQADQYQEFFSARGVGVVTSHSKNDLDSLNIELFRNDPAIQLLIVVNRGILGFDMDTLVNVIDMTGSRNIDSIYQLYARAMRKHPNHPKKYFFKIVEEGQLDLAKFYMTAALSLSSREFLENYNGRNLDGMRIAMHKIRTERADSGDAGDTSSQQNRGPRTVPIDEYFHGQISVLRVMKEVLSRMGEESYEYAYTTLRSVKESLGMRIRDPEGRKQEIREAVERGEFSRKHRLYLTSMGYASSKTDAYDLEFREWMISRGALRENRISKDPVGDLIRWCRENNRYPKNRAMDVGEERMGQSLMYYRSKKHPVIVELENLIGPYNGSERQRAGIAASRKQVINLDTGEIYPSISEAARQIGKRVSAVHQAIRLSGKCAGFRWAYASDTAEPQLQLPPVPVVQERQCIPSI